MNSERWPEVKEHLDALLDLGPAERDNYLDRHCAGDETLRAEVVAYLSAEHEVAAFPSEPFVDLFEARPPEGREGQRLGAWRLSSRIGQGGMGVVYLALRDDGVYEQKAAVKVLKRGFDTGEIVRRFTRERRILARLDHPNVARVLDGGATEDGLPYFVMEHVDGRPIDDYCRGLPLGTVLELFQSICETVQVAHQNLIVHCDLKPANILVTADGIPKLLDFGIAKLLAPDDGEVAGTRTLAEWRLGTPGYSSPEQRQGEPITTASDVYSLGALLHGLLTGRKPGVELGRPSATSDRWGRRLRGDLDTVVLKALHPEPARRYASAGALAEDVRRHLGHWPVMARPEGAFYRLGRFVRRNPAGTTTAGAVLLLIAVFVALLAAQLRETEVQRDRALQLRDKVLDILGSLDPDNARAETEELAEVLEQTVRTELAFDLADRALLLDRTGRIYRRLGYPNEARKRLEESLKLRRRIPGIAPQAVAASLQSLGTVLVDQGETRRGVAMLTEAIEVREGHDPGDLAARIHTLTTFAKGLEAQGQFAEAEVLYRDLLEPRREHYGERSAGFARGLNNLAVVLLRQGKLEEADELFVRSLDLWEALRGTEDSDYVTTEVNFAVLLDARSDFREAIRHERHALAVRRNGFDESSRVVARGYGALAFSLLGSGGSDELAEAEALLRRAIGIYESQEDPHHPDVLVFRRNLAAVRIARGDPEGAEALARDVLELSLEKLEPGHWRIADARSVLGESLLVQGRRREAERLLVESLPVIREATGERSRYTREAQERCAELLDP